jgi:hypothetical protein
MLFHHDDISVGRPVLQVGKDQLGHYLSIGVHARLHVAGAWWLRNLLLPAQPVYFHDIATSTNSFPIKFHSSCTTS